MRALGGAVGLVMLVVLACDSGQVATRGQASAATASALATPRTAAKAPPTAAEGTASANEISIAGSTALTPGEFGRLFRELSEADRYFFSDNLISNETSYLDVMPVLQRLPREGVYLGVGPEQNFAYLAALQPQLAFIVDIRRDNALLHLLHKACFEDATSRAHFLSSLIGRDYHQPSSRPSEQAAELGLSAVFADVASQARDSEMFDRIHARLIDRIVSNYGIKLSDKDRERLRFMHQTLFEQGLELRFELHQKNGRKYPTLGELLSETDAKGQAQGFLATEQAFSTVQRLQRENRIIPVVGDFAGPHALKAIAQELTTRKLTVSAFYVSNVEQYLLDPPLWKAWVENVQALPRTDTSVFIRAYLDQGKPHPRQRPGQRTATLAQPLAAFPTGTRPPANLLALTSEGVIEH